MDYVQYTQLTNDLREELSERLSIRARTFPKAVRKAGRLLPAKARAAAQDLVALEQRLVHPKLASRTDPAQATQAAVTIRNALSHHRPGARAAWQRSLLFAEIGFRALIVIGVALAIVQWQSGA